MLGSIRWRWGLLAALAMSLLALFPQLYLWHERGPSWEGANAYFYTDEAAYAAYINALIDGRPRRCDPYTGVDDTSSAPLPESLFSIQFIPAYMIALPARSLGLSTAQTFILLSPLVAFTVSLGVFWLLALFTGDDRASAAFVPFVLCLGLMLSGNGFIRWLLRQQPVYVYLPFLRRYVPAVPFCFLMFFFPLVWQSLTSDRRRRRIGFALGAGVCFAGCVYGYFYLWTAAAAWLSLLAVLWLAAKPARGREGLESLALTGLLALIALVPYAVLLSKRAPTMDVVQALVRTHAPDPWRLIEFSALLAFTVLVAGLKRKQIDPRNPRVLFSVAFALVPFVLFNQQVITGRSLQPMHYEQFVAPYFILLAAVLGASLFWNGPGRRLPLPILLIVFGLTYGWGAGETWTTTRRFAAANVSRDKARAVSSRLRDIVLKGYDDATGERAERHAVVFASDIARADSLPMVAPQAVLWAPHMFVFSGVTAAENKERFFQYLYYFGIEADQFVLNYQRQGFVNYAIFGWERANPRLTVNYKPISEEELQLEAHNYSEYITHFDRPRAAEPTLSFMIVNADQQMNFAHLDRWYARDHGERIGPYVLYRLRLRP